MHRIKLKTEKDVSKKATVFDADIEYMVHSYNSFHKFMERIHMVSRCLEMFWKEMQLQRPNFKRLGTLGFKVSEVTEDLKHQYEEMRISHIYMVQATLIYVGFFSKVLNKDENSLAIRKLLSKIGIETHHHEEVNNTSSAIKNLKIGEFSSWEEATSLGIDYLEESHKLNKRGIIVCSGEQKYIGEIINTNNRIYQMFGYSNKEMVG